MKAHGEIRYRFTIHMPLLADLYSQEKSVEHTKAFERKLIFLGGGFTRHPASGAWINPVTGKVEYDRQTVYVVDTDPCAGVVDKVSSLVEKYRKLLKQASIYWTWDQLSVMDSPPEPRRGGGTRLA